MNLSELWIGDEVYVKSIKRNAIWEGRHGTDKAKVKLDNVSLLVDTSELSEPIAMEEEAVVFQIADENENVIVDNSDEIDLHINVLNPGFTDEAPQLILNHQIKRCRTFIENAINSKKLQILIIHGVGAGVLKSEVLHLIQDYDEVKFTVPKNNGGAIELWLQY